MTRRNVFEDNVVEMDERREQKLAPWAKTGTGIRARRIVYDVMVRFTRWRMVVHRRKAGHHAGLMQFWGRHHRDWQRMERP